MTSAATNPRALTHFQFQDNPVTIELDEAGNPWFRATEVCAALRYVNPRDAVAKHVDPEDVAKRDTLSAGGKQQATFVNESGLFALIFGSKLPSAIEFKKWVTRDVLPSIRKTGGYQAHPASDPTGGFDVPKSYRDALLAMADQVDRIDALEAEKAVMLPKVAAHDRIAESFGSVCRKIAAKNLGVPPAVLNRWMDTNKWTYRHANGDTLAYQSKVGAGYLEHKINTGTRPDGTAWTSTSVHVTPKGMLALAKLIPRETAFTDALPGSLLAEDAGSHPNNWVH